MVVVDVCDEDCDLLRAEDGVGERWSFGDHLVEVVGEGVREEAGASGRKG